MTSILSIPNYGLVLAVATSCGFLNIYQSILVGRSRKAANVDYPSQYATAEQCKANFKAQQFNCAQRAHGNTLESLPMFLFTLLYSGTQYPRVAASLGSLWVISRVLYTRGYATGDPAKRNQGVFHVLGLLGLLGTACFSTYNIIIAGLLKTVASLPLSSGNSLNTISTRKRMLKLYECMGSKLSGPLPLFCPTAVKVRLTLINKAIPFETIFVTYHDLRFIWKDKLKVDRATTPFIEMDDGEFVMDSDAIAEYLDKKFPNSASAYLPEGTTPVDIKSPEYVAAKEDYLEFNKILTGIKGPVFTLFAPIITTTFDKDGPENDFSYWTSDARLGAGTWARLQSASIPETIIAAKKSVEPLNAIILQSPANQKFFSSKNVPGWKDATLYGLVRLLKGTSSSNCQTVFGEGPIGTWLKNIESHYEKELVEVNIRDMK